MYSKINVEIDCATEFQSQVINNILQSLTLALTSNRLSHKDNKIKIEENIK